MKDGAKGVGSFRRVGDHIWMLLIRAFWGSSLNLIHTDRAPEAMNVLFIASGALASRFIMRRNAVLGKPAGRSIGQKG